MNMIGTLIYTADISVRTGSWILGKAFQGASYLVYGSKPDPVLTKLEELENKLNHKNNLEESPNLKYYWLTKHKYQNNYWVVISNDTLLIQTERKTTAIMIIAEYEEEFPERKCLLIQVGNEINLHEL